MNRCYVMNQHGKGECRDVQEKDIARLLEDGYQQYQLSWTQENQTDVVGDLYSLHSPTREQSITVFRELRGNRSSGQLVVKSETGEAIHTIQLLTNMSH